MTEKTIDVLNNVTNQDRLLIRITEIRKQYYRNLTIYRPTNKKYLRGWLSRVDDCLKVEI